MADRKQRGGKGMEEKSPTIKEMHEWNEEAFMSLMNCHIRTLMFIKLMKIALILNCCTTLGCYIWILILTKG